MAVIRDFLYGLRYTCVIALAATALVILFPVAVQSQYSRQKPYSDETLGNANALANKVTGSVMNSVAQGIGPAPRQTQPVASPGPRLIDPGNGEQVLEVRVVGNKTTKKEKILPHIRTRAGREFIQEEVERDVRRLNATRMFVDIRVSYQHLPNGRVVIFEVVERPTIQYVKYIGNRKIKRKLLEKETSLKVGDALDPYMAEDARRSLELYYHDHGFGLARVTVIRGNKPGDRGVAFEINEGPKQRILTTKFVGVTVVTPSRLLTKVRAKHGFFWLFNGEFDRKIVEEDRNILTAYYRDLGYFQAKVGIPEITYSGKNREWVTITYVIHEGVRSKVNSISVVGNTKIPTDKLLARLKLHEGEFYNHSKKRRDEAAIEEEYGSVGYIFAKIRGENRLYEEPGKVDIVYNISEGDQYRVGRIIPQISGENPHTQITTMLNRISLQPGDIVDIREIRDSKRRLKACGLFEVSPHTGVVPDIVISDPSEAVYPSDRNPEQIARPNSQATPKDSGFRGQSPDGNWPGGTRPNGTGARPEPTGGVRWIDLKLIGRPAVNNEGGGR